LCECCLSRTFKPILAQAIPECLKNPIFRVPEIFAMPHHPQGFSPMLRSLLLLFALGASVLSPHGATAIRAVKSAQRKWSWPDWEPDQPLKDALANVDFEKFMKNWRDATQGIEMGGYACGYAHGWCGCACGNNLGRSCQLPKMSTGTLGGGHCDNYERWYGCAAAYNNISGCPRSSGR